MSNITEYQITEEGYRNAVIKLTGVLDTSDVYLKPAVALNFFNSNEPNANLVGLRVDLLEYSVGPVLEVLLEWAGNSPQQIYNLSKAAKIFAYGYGGFVPDQLRSGYSGNINLKTAGYSPGTVQSYTIVLELIKLYKA